MEDHLNRLLLSPLRKLSRGSGFISTKLHFRQKKKKKLESNARKSEEISEIFKSIKAWYGVTGSGNLSSFVGTLIKGNF